jgi:putative multiple sugar transport system ATP-binding protein
LAGGVSPPANLAKGGFFVANILLEMKNITKTFPGVKALDNVNLAVEEGEIHALVGENGAGKSTLMNILSGIYPYGSYEGDIIYNGEICKYKGIKDSEHQGIVIIHQELALVPYLTIAENMFLGNEQGKRFSIDWDGTYANAEKLLRKVGLQESPHTQIKDIGDLKTAAGRDREGPRQKCETADTGRAYRITE